MSIDDVDNDVKLGCFKEIIIAGFTDCMRNGFFDGVWVSFVKKEIIENPDKNFVIPDVRFINEIEIIKSLNSVSQVITYVNSFLEVQI